MSSIQIRICGRYRLGQKIAKGNFSSIYIGKNVQSNNQCAIKCQQKKSNIPLIINQGNILTQLQGGMGIPTLYWQIIIIRYGPQQDYIFLITDLLGNNLQDYLNLCQRKFSLKTVLMIADQLLTIIQFIHYKGYIHRDIKPQNILMGLGKKNHQIHLIDYGLSKKYKKNKQQHILQNHFKNGFIGTIRYVSINVHNKIQPSRRDDLISIGYVLVYLLKGNLPWQNCKAQNVIQKFQKVGKKKNSISLQQLCIGCPIQFVKYFHSVSQLSFVQTPDYAYLRRLLKQRFVSEGYQFDYVYDWFLKPLKFNDIKQSYKFPIKLYLDQIQESQKQNNLSFKNYLKIQNEINQLIQKMPKSKKKEQRNMTLYEMKKQSSQKKKEKKVKKQKECIIF